MGTAMMADKTEKEKCGRLSAGMHLFYLPKALLSTSSQDP
jgi:hypothetical protein